MEEQKEHERKQVAVSAFWVALGTVTSRGLGFIRDIVIAHYFSRTATDAFVVAFRIPNLFRRLFGEGALTISFIPVLSDFIKNDDKKGAREFTAKIFTLLFVVLSALTALGTLGAGPLVTELTKGEGFTGIAGKMDLTIHQTKIMFCYIFLVSLYAFWMGILNTFRVFWLPAVAPALWNITMIVGVLFFRNTFEPASDVLAWATVVGGVVQAGVLLPSLIKYDFYPRFSRWWGDPAVNRVLRSMGPSILGLSVMQIGVLINTHFASHLPEGSNSWIFWADRILEFPLSLFAVSVGTAALPTLSAFWSRGDREGMSNASLHALKLSLFMAVPCAAGLFMISQPMVRTLFEHGRFTSHDTEMTAAVIKVYGFGVIFGTAVRVLAPAFYAMKNTWLPALSAAIALVVHVSIANYFMNQWGVVGLATSSVLSGGVNFLILLIAYHFMVAPLKYSKLLFPVLKFVIASLAMAAVTQIYPMAAEFFGDHHIGRIISLGVVLVLCAATYFIVSYILKTNELIETTGEFTKRIKRRLGR